MIRVSPEKKPGRASSKQSLSTLLEERELEHEDTYEALSNKYDNLTFADTRDQCYKTFLSVIYRFS